MFKDFAESLFQFDKIPNKIFFAGIVLGVLYFCEPFSWIVYELPVNWKPYVGVFSCISLVMFLTNFTIWTVTKINNWFKVRAFKKNCKTIYENLDPFEMNVLREFYLLNRSTLNFPYLDPIIQGLTDRQVIIPASTLAGGRYIMHGKSVSYQISKYIKPLIHTNDFDFPTSNSEAETIRIQQSRPHWVYERYYL